MNKNKCLFIGVGQCGNNYLEELMSLDKRFIGLFVNSSYTDMNGLSKVNINRNVFLIPNADGSGGNRDVAKSYARESGVNLLEMINGYKLQDVIYFIFSMGGGTGSGLVPTLINAVKQKMPNKVINIIGIKASVDEHDERLSNTIECWNELMKVKDKINSITIIDNDKRNDIMELNKIWAKDMNDAFNISGEANIRGAIDTNDATNLLLTSGYSIMYRLDPKIRDANIALQKAISDSIYMEVNDQVCRSIGVFVDGETYNPDDIMKQYTVIKGKYKGVHPSKENLVILTGCSTPNTSIQLMKCELKGRENDRKAIQIDESNLSVELDVEEEKPANNINKTVIISSKDFDDIDDDFWGSL